MLKPVRSFILVADLTDNERKELGFPAGIGESVEVAVVMGIGPEVSLEVNPGDWAYFVCSAPKCGAELRLIHSDCVVGVNDR